MDRQTLLWTLVAFFGASVAFRLVGDLTDGSEAWVRVVLQVATLAAILGLILLIVRKRS